MMIKPLTGKPIYYTHSYFLRQALWTDLEVHVTKSPLCIFQPYMVA